MTQTKNLPAKLREKGLFCVWRRETRQDRPTKLPYNPKTGGGAMSNNPATFAPLEVAQAATGYDGLGVGVFASLGAIDIDHCISETGEISDMAVDIMSIMEAYTEYSPSGTGLRILFNADSFQYDKARFYTMNAGRGLEVYIAGCTSKFVTVTGNALTPGLDLEERGSQLQAVLEKYMVRPERKPPSLTTPVGAVDIEDVPLIEKAKRGKNGAVFSALWAGDISSYPSHSEADQALCNSLAWWTNGDATRVDRLFRQSGLMREKWDRPQSGSTYGAITIENAVSSCAGGYAPQDYFKRKADTTTKGTNGDSVRPPDFSDAGNASVFSRTYQGDLVFVDALGWLWWTGEKWERNDHKAVAWALELSARMLKEAGKENREALHLQAEAKAKYAESGEAADGEAVKAAEAEVAKTKAYLSHAKNTRNAIRIKNMLELSKPSLVLKADKLDANPFDLNTPAGIANLTTGQIRPHERTAYCSQITGVSPGVQGADMWAGFLDTITCNDGSIRGFIQLVAGMALIGSVYQEGIVIAYGGGRNGKSTVFNAIGQALGDYTGSIDIKTITTDRANKGASLATLRGKRLVITGELEEHQRLSVATLKQLASTDKLVIEEKFKQPESVKQTHTLVLFTNHLPRVGSTDGGTWRRLIVVPFNATIPAGAGVQNYADVLVEKAGGAILSWAIEGAVNFVRNGFRLTIPDVVAEATEAYREREDWLNNFIDERCIKEPNARVGAAELYREYREWAEATGDYVRRLNDFTIGMEAAGFQKVTPKNKKTWVGIRLDLEAKFGNAYAASY